jgi:hypothetical protein
VQRAAIELAYRGWMPLVYSRYGYRQLQAPLPWSKVVVKDPFAMLSIPAIVRQTGAVPILVYRHPGAVLASYRRMGWRPDLDEVGALVRLPSASAPEGMDPMVVDMARFWTALNSTALSDLSQVGDAVVVSHEELAAGGMPALRRLFLACDVEWDATTEDRVAKAGSDSGPASTSKSLHDLNRAPEQVAQAWRRHVSDDEVAALVAVAGLTLGGLDQRRVVLT